MKKKKPAASRNDKVVPIDTKDPSAEQIAKQLTLAQKMGLVPMPPGEIIYHGASTSLLLNKVHGLTIALTLAKVSRALAIVISKRYKGTDC